MKPDSSIDDSAHSPSTTNLSGAFLYAARCGWNASRHMLLPAAIIQVLMFLLVLGYYLNWRSTIILKTLAGWQTDSDKIIAHGSLIFNFVSTGLAAGVLAEIFKVYLVQRGKWTAQNLKDGAFKFIIIGMGGLVAGISYVLQGKAFGTHASVQTVVLKVLVDQFIFNPIFVAPLPCLINQGLEHGFSWATLARCFSVEFYIRRILPLLFSTWCFWLPMVSLIYSLPSLLQFPLFLCASTIWGLIFTSLINPKG